MRTALHIRLLNLLFFLFCIHANAQSFSDSLEHRILNAQREGRVLDKLSNDFIQHPKGEFLLAGKGRDLRYAILIYNISIFSGHAEFSAGMAFRDPKSNQLVAFRADHVVFSYTNGLAGPAKLYLEEDVNMSLGKAAVIRMQSGAEETYAVFDCSGLQEFGVAGKVEFNSAFLVPSGPDGQMQPGQILKAAFALRASAWSDMVVQVSLQPFQIIGLTGFVFSIDKATMDLSERMNAPEMQFPDAYAAENILGNQWAIWEGFYLKSGSVTIPKHFQSTSSQSLQLGVANLLIDEWGFSGSVYGKNLLEFDNGRIAGWNLSIDLLEVNVLQNEITGGRMAGSVGLPVLSDTSKLGYKAYISAHDHYGMQVFMRNTLSIPALKIARADIAPNSFVDISINEGQVLLNAELNGELKAENKGEGSVAFTIPAIAFQGFRVSNKSPQFDIAYLGLKNAASGSQMNQYPINIHSLYFRSVGIEKQIGIGLGLNLMDKISVKTGLMIGAEMETGRLKFRGISVNDIDIAVTTGCFSLAGKLSFIRRDPVFGNGMNGQIRVVIEQPKIMASADILFGNIDGHRYWYFDASAIWDQPGIPLFPGAEINGFMGGAWKGMREANARDDISKMQYGRLSSGRVYVPDKTGGYGLKAAVYLRSSGSSGSSSAFVASVLLEMHFNGSNGLSKIIFSGNIDLMTSNNQPEKGKLKQSVSTYQGADAWTAYKANYIPKGQLGGPFFMQFDFSNKIYQANFAVYLSGVGGDKISGSGPRGLAGEAAAYFSPQKWYVWVGTPQQPVGVKIDLGAAGNAAVSSYFMAGTEVKPAAPLPHEITYLLGERSSDAMRDMNALAEGSGFAFGSRLDLVAGSSGGEGNVSIYASLKAIVGFDVNVRAYGKQTFCAGRTGPPGINGWFANGQLFAFMQGRVGASYKVGGLSGTADLLTMTFASQLFCQGPNPFYSKGSTVVQVNIAGVINKKLNLGFEIGEACELNRKAMSDTSIILSVIPSDNEAKVNVCTAITTRFSVPVEQAFTDADGRTVVFRLGRFEVSDGMKSIQGEMLWNNSKNSMVFQPSQMLPGNQKITVLVSIEAVTKTVAYELRNTDGTISVLMQRERERYSLMVTRMQSFEMAQADFGAGRKIIRTEKYVPVVLNGKAVSETKVISFQTDKAPAGIPLQNIAYAWPCPDQLNYYKGFGKGYIKLKVAQDELLNSKGSSLMAWFVDDQGAVKGESKVVYKNKLLEYLIPDPLLKENSVYQLVICNATIGAASKVGHNINEQQAVSAGQTAAFRPLLNFSFGVSRSSGLNIKLSGMAEKQQTQIQGSSLLMQWDGKAFEGFDKAELAADAPLVRFTLDRSKNTWLGKEASKIYTIFKCGDKDLLAEVRLQRDTSLMGLLPYKAVRIERQGLEKQLLVAGKAPGSKVKPAPDGNAFAIENYAYEILTSDMENIRSGLIRYVSGTTDPNLKVVRNYIDILQTYGNTYESGQVTGENNRSSMTSAASFNAFTNLTGLPVTSNVVLPGAGPDAQRAYCLMKISQLKLKQLELKDNVPLSMAFYLPGMKDSAYIFLLKP